MSPSSLDGLNEVASRQKRESYEPGTQGFDSALVFHIIDEYLTEGLSYTAYKRSDILEEFMKLIPADEHFKKDAFLDELIHQADLQVPPSSLRYFPRVLDPLVQGMYNNGHNDFILDLRPMQVKGEGEIFMIFRRIGHQLKGRPDEPLRARYHCFAENLADWAQHCSITHDGSTHSGGYGAYQSELDFRGGVEEYAWQSEECVVHVTKLEPGEVFAHDCVFHAERIPEELSFSHPAWQYFFERRNTLVYLKDGDWKEVKP